MTRAQQLTLVRAAATAVAGLLVTSAVCSGPVQAASRASSRFVAPASGPSGHLTAASASGAALNRTATDAGTPLEVELLSITPSTLTGKGPIQIVGSVTNTDSAVWTDVNVFPFTSQHPMTTRTELAEAAQSAASAEVGDRIVDRGPGTFAEVGDLAPKQTATFRIVLGRDDTGLSGAPGVYWLGAHALGTAPDGTRDRAADGRARSFVPLVPRKIARTRSTSVAVVLPVRGQVRRDAAGRLAKVPRWVRQTSPDGRLTRLAEFGASAGGNPMTWLIDPAVVDAVGSLAQGNPPLSLATTGSQQPQGEAPEPSASPSGSATSPGGEASSGPSGSASPAPGTPTEEQRQLAQTWVELIQQQAGSHGLLALGYGDPDVSALLRLHPSLLRRAQALTIERLKAHKLIGVPVVAPPAGDLDPAHLDRLAKDALVLLSDKGAAQKSSSWNLPTGQDLVFSDQRTASGSPAPTAPHDPLGLRQRLLADAALNLLDGGAEPIVSVLPPLWDPGAHWREANFFGGLSSAPWLRLTDVPRAGASTWTQPLPYTAAQEAGEVPPENLSASLTLIRTGRVLSDLLTGQSSVADQLTASALSAASYTARRDPAGARGLVLGQDLAVRDLMRKVKVTGTDFVTLSGGSGVVTVAVVNDLDEPVTVGLATRSEGHLRIDTPEPVKLGPGERSTVRLNVHASQIGVHDVVVVPVTAEGAAVGQELAISLRTSQVGRLIWWVIGAGGALLAVMITRRIVRRIRDRSWRSDD